MKKISLILSCIVLAGTVACASSKAAEKPAETPAAEGDKPADAAPAEGEKPAETPATPPPATP